MSALELSAALYSTLPSPPRSSPGLEDLFEAAGLPIPVLVFVTYFSPTIRSCFISLLCLSFSSFPQTWGPKMF